MSATPRINYETYKLSVMYILYPASIMTCFIFAKITKIKGQQGGGASIHFSKLYSKIQHIIDSS